MSSEKTKHAVCLRIPCFGYNALVGALIKNLTCGADAIEDEAQKLLEKINTHARFYIDENGTECAELRFFESEAVELIWQYIALYCDGITDVEDYYHARKERPEEITGM